MYNKVISNSSLVLIFILISLSCNINEKKEDFYKNKLLSKIDKKDTVIIFLSDIFIFDWDTVYIFPPYTSPDEIRKNIKINHNHINSLGLEHMDNFNLFLFKKGNYIKEYILLDRVIDFSYISHRKYSRKNAIFKLVKKYDSHYYEAKDIESNLSNTKKKRDTS